MKIKLLVSALLTLSTFAKEFKCPEKFDPNFQNLKHQDFEIISNGMDYPLLSANLYSGHPKDLYAIKGNNERRKVNERPFWLVCNYKVNESTTLAYKFAKEISSEYIECSYLNNFQGVKCKN